MAVRLLTSEYNDLLQIELDASLKSGLVGILTCTCSTSCYLRTSAKSTVDCSTCNILQWWMMVVTFFALFEPAMSVVA